jgi:hypothetical protein
MGCFPQYKFPQAITRYGEIAVYCGFCKPEDEPMKKVEVLCEKIYKLLADSEVSPWIKDFRNAPSEEEYFAALDYLAE